MQLILKSYPGSFAHRCSEGEERVTSQEEVSRALESKPMVAVPMWRKDQSPAITSPLGGKCREAGRVTCQQEGRRAIAVLTSAWFCLMATVRPRKVCLQNRQHAVVLHCWELPGHQSGQFIHGHFCRRKLHVDALQLQRGRLMEHSEAQFKALNVLRANLPWGQSALSGTTHRAGLAGEWSS